MTNYKKAGVDIDAGNLAEDVIANIVKETYNPSVVSGVGSFGAVVSLNFLNKKNDFVLVSSVDGVGTKLKVAAMMNKWDSVGADIVNHCSNDILCMGAKPLFFMDYIASSKLKPKVVSEIVKGMALACKSLGCPLVGGETAEMPGVYFDGEHDIVGFMVGFVKRKMLLVPSKVKEKDVLIGLASNGLHTNGFSLARKVLLEDAGFKVSDYSEDLESTVGEALLKVHKSYSKVVLGLQSKVEIHGIAHITGGGIVENLPRIIPPSLEAKYDFSQVVVPPIFSLIQKKGNISKEEMYRVFNMGIGLVLVVKNEDADNAISFLRSRGEVAWVIGTLEKKKN